jgi:hypothetical protein
MFPQTIAQPHDDPAFLAVIDRIVEGLAARAQPQDIRVIAIDNWFGPKWLRYSGKGVVAFPYGYSAGIVVALDDHYQDKLTFPPFTRNRIVSEHYFARLGNDIYEEQCPASLGHRRRWRWREQKLHRRVAGFSSSGLFVWYSSRTASNDQASLLVYTSSAEQVSGWYAGFARVNRWHIGQVKGINRDALCALVGSPAAR